MGVSSRTMCFLLVLFHLFRPAEAFFWEFLASIFCYFFGLLCPSSAPPPSPTASAPSPTLPTQPGPWVPPPGSSFQLQLQGDIDTSFVVDMYEIDIDSPQDKIDSLRAAGRIVICYLSAGSYENYRDDKDDFPPALLGKTLDGWPDEKWLDIRNENLKPILRRRLDKAVLKRCDGVDPDNVNGFENDTGFDLTAADQLAFNRWLAGEAHARGLSVGLKNDIGQIPDLVDYFDWALNEQCYQYSECSLLTPFVAAGKAVFGVEYQGDPAQFCPTLNAMQFSWLKKGLELSALPRIDCRNY